MYPKSDETGNPLQFHPFALAYHAGLVTYLEQAIISLQLSCFICETRKITSTSQLGLNEVVYIEEFLNTE